MENFILGQGAQTWIFLGAHLDGFRFPSGFRGLGLVDPQDFPKRDLLSCHRQKILLVSALCRDIVPCLHGASDCCEQLFALDSGPCSAKNRFWGILSWVKVLKPGFFPGAHLDGFQFPSGFWGLGLVDPQDFPKGDFLSCHRQKKKDFFLCRLVGVCLFKRCAVEKVRRPVEKGC